MWFQVSSFALFLVSAYQGFTAVWDGKSRWTVLGWGALMLLGFISLYQSQL